MTGGWGTPTRPEDWSRLEERYSLRVLHNARRALADRSERVRQDEADASVYWVVGSQGDTYRVQIVPMDGSEEPDLPWVACTCANGQNKGGQPKCFHSAAALMAWLNSDEAEE